MDTQAIYFDNNGTTALDQRVLETMLPYLSAQSGNATSRHIFGRSSRQAIERAREQVADATGAHPSQVIFTGSGTEADNLAICGITAKNGFEKIAVSAIEHPAITRAAQSMKAHGVVIESIAADTQGKITIDALQDLLSSGNDDKSIGLISVMLANNETGAIQDLASIAEIARKQHAFVHTDAVQALGKMKVDFAELNVHAMSLSSHKISGPQGAGALILDKRVDIQPLLLGGGQERGLRSGSENVAAIVGFGAACELISRELIQRIGSVRQLRDQLEKGLVKLGAVIFGHGADRLANTSFFAFEGIEGETLVMALDRKGFAVASGSACSSDSTEPSHVLMAMGVDEDLARGAIRVSLSNVNTAAQIEAFLLVLEGELSRLRRLTAIAV
ncbi:cysteine desulfurase [Methylovorus sp. MM2]|uniref:cysteine desulfurase family protein n=1 Tax=Methylovorus sp. MM2 TaxID=1848038 RepID=UPI0007E1685A|nr:cysteine desulfurase family protein [Methylovorus sp. MM2]OAM52555.1 cysteine desulfurase [Methylovorus sp. MM2]